ncbi:DUF6520 family protein [Flavobacterium sp.]|uniref:DUF6520 family protein n=1 Tax=Flavobacterium sp. TaxID=239 RepID=UPI0039E2D64A
MKANLLKMILPVAAFALASAGAVTTSNQKTAKAEGKIVQGWTIDCVELRQCNNTMGSLCKQAGVQAYEKDGNDCSEALFHKP